MGLPSKRTPKNKTRTRNNPANPGKSLVLKSTNTCPKCGAAKLSHRACGACGAYKAEKIAK